MKLLILTAVIAAVASSPLTGTQNWPWQANKEYVYNVDSYTWATFKDSNSTGNAFKAQFIIRVSEPGRLVAKIENPLYAQVQGQISLSKDTVPSGLNYNPAQAIEPFEILVDGGRVVSLKVSTSLSKSYENLLKGLVSALQVDLSSVNHVHSFPNSFDSETFQGLFKKMETDVTGNCETLYSVSPVSAEWRRELPVFAEDPIEITKSKNYGSCVKNVGYDFGVPEGAVWKGIAYDNDEKQFIKHTSESRILVGKQGTIYKSETLSSVFVNPLVFGTQKAEVYSYVSLYLSSVQPEHTDDWKKDVEYRTVESLLYTFDEAAFTRGSKNIANAQQLLQIITPLLQDPSNLSKADFLSKFNILVRSIMFMNREQLAELTSSIEVAKASKNVAKNNMWIIYRDAVAQAGTIAAFKEIKSWILTKKIEGDDAAEVISSMASVLHIHNKEIMTEFFDFVMSSEVQEQKYLNTTALLAVTKYISMGDEIFFVEEKVIPRLSQELKQAIEKGDKNKAQVYVRVLGNLADPNILKVFAPYLEGQIPVTKYLRIQMVISLKTVANTKNEYVRAVLFSLLKNTAEPYEVRVAAALNIFLAYPTQEMMQIMAHMTNDDPSTQVRAVLANGINFAAGLKDPRFTELAKTAKSVLYLVSKEKFGYRYSTDSLIDEYTSDDEFAYFRELSYIGSKNNLLPVYQRGALRFGSTGVTEEEWFTLSVSDMQHLWDYLTGLYLQPSRKVDDDFRFSAKKIVDILNLKSEHRCDLEGSFFLNTWNQQTLYTFDENDLKSLITNYAKKMQQQLTGENYYYTKVLIQKQIFITFPLAMGMPFMFDYSEPTAIIQQFEYKTKIGEQMSISSDIDLKFTYAQNLDGSVGFLDTLGDVYASTGIINKLQFYFPVKLNTAVAFKEVKFNFELPKQNANLFHMSVWPYTTLRKTDSLLTILENPLTELIKRPGEELPSSFRTGSRSMLDFEARTYSSDWKDRHTFTDLNVRDLLYQKDVALTEFNLKYSYDSNKPTNDFTFTVYYDTVYKLEDDSEETIDEMGPAANMNDVTPNSKARREEIVKRVQRGMQSPKVQLVDISAVYGEKVNIFTGAYASSFVDPKVQAAVFLVDAGNRPTNAVFKITKPVTVPLNLEEALKNKINVSYEADIKILNNDNIHFQGVGVRSEEYTQKLLNDPLGKQCMQETNKKNFFQKDCYKMIIKAHAPDYFVGRFTNIKESTFIHNFVSSLIHEYRLMYKNVVSWEPKENLFKTSENVTVDLEAQAFYDENFITSKITTNYGVWRFNKIEGMSYYPYAMAFYAPLTSWERARNWFTDYQNLPFCAVDDSKIWTYSGRSYDYRLTSAWHVVMVDEAKEFGNDLVILMRRPSDHQAEVYVSYKSQTGKAFEMELTAKTIEVITNITQLSDGGLSTYFDDVAKAPLLQYYTIAPDTELYSINNGAIRFMFDTHRLVIFTDDHRSTTRGICGQSTTQTSDDYMTPYGLVDLPELYGASFSLESETKEYSDAKTAELKKEAKLKAYQPVTKYTNILRSDAEWRNAENESVKGL